MSDPSFSPAQIRCLLVDDDPGIRELLTGFLLPFNMRLDAVADGAGMRQRLPSPEVDVLLLDVMLPGESGLDLCQWVKREQPGLPVIMLTAQGDTLSRVVGLELGADDYLPKPFEPRELLARIRAVLRRRTDAPTSTAAPSKALLQFGTLEIDRDARAVSVNGEACELTSYQFDLLIALAERAGRVLTRDQIMEAVRGRELEAFDRSIDVHMGRIRLAIEADAKNPKRILTVRGVGYVFAKQQD